MCVLLTQFCLHVSVEKPGIKVGIYGSRSCLRICLIVYALICYSIHIHITYTQRTHTCMPHTHRGGERERAEIYKH